VTVFLQVWGVKTVTVLDEIILKATLEEKKPLGSLRSAIPMHLSQKYCTKRTKLSSKKTTQKVGTPRGVTARSPIVSRSIVSVSRAG
jgi:hypothetical protein